MKTVKTKPAPEPTAKPASEAASPPIVGAANQVCRVLFAACLGLMVVVPLAMNTAVYHPFVAPKFALLLAGSALLLVLLALVLHFDIRGGKPAAGERLRLLGSMPVLLVSLYVVAVAVSTWFGVAPLASLFGSLESRMGLLSYLCFLIFFIALIVGIGRSEPRLVMTLWTMAGTGLVTSAYAFAQFVGRDPFLSPAGYTVASTAGAVLRVPGTLGHADYLGNFLLYTTPVSAALALMSNRRARRIGLFGVALSVAAIIFSGTRGAWLGALSGLAAAGALAYFNLRQGRAAELQTRRESGPRLTNVTRRQKIAALTVAAVILASAGIIASSPRLISITRRLRSSVQDATGAGRTLLWRDAVKMVPRYAVTGCGPEGFSKAFLPYKSRQLARTAPQVTDESSHDAYLDALISSGLAGGILLPAMLFAVARLLWRTRKRASGTRSRMMIYGLLVALIAVSVHNVFIYNQIPMALYFFALMALAIAAANVVAGEPESEKPIAATAPFRWPGLIGWVMTAVCTAVLVGACWYGWRTMRADLAIKRAFRTAEDYQQLVRNGQDAVDHDDAVGQYRYLFARALANFVDFTDFKSGDSAASSPPNRAEAIELATVQAQAALPNSLTPHDVCVTLAYLGLAARDNERLRVYATQAVGWDPNFYSAHWLMAESLLADGDLDGALAEAQQSLDLKSDFRNAISARARAHGQKPRDVPGLLEAARQAENNSAFWKASKMLKRAVRQSRGPCPPCHRALAIVYEKMGIFEKAVNEWTILESEAPDLAATEQASVRIKSLREKAAAEERNRH